MIRNELYKIITKKNLIFLMIFFCGINVFYVHHEAVTSEDSVLLNTQIYSEISQMDSEKREAYLSDKADELSGNRRFKGTYEKYCDVLNYSRAISGFRENILQITEPQESAFENLLYRDGSFASRNKKKIETEYQSKNIAEIRPVFGNYEGVRKGVQSGVHDIFLMIMFIAIAMCLVMQEKQDGLTRLQHPTVCGRGKLYLAKFLGAAISAAAVTVVVQGVHLCTYIYYYGCDSLFVPIQSVNGFAQSTLRINIFQYILVYMGFKITASIVCISVILLLCVVCQNVVQVYLSTMILAVAEGALYFFIGEHDALCGLKFFNLFSISDVYSVTRMYFNINLCEIPFNILKCNIFLKPGYWFCY